MPGGIPMPRGGTALRNRPRQGLPPGLIEPVRRRSMASHHRRRRGIAMLVIAVIALLIAIAVSGGGSSAPHHVVVRSTTGFFARIRALAGSGPRSFSWAEAAAENAAINRTLSYTPYVRIAGAQHREIALTFDDGPGPYTPQVLSVLERENVPATFFEVGIEEQYFHAGTSAMVAHGYPIGDHTMSHAAMSRLGAADQRAQLLAQAKAIKRYGAPFPRLFRPPYGLWDSTTLSLLHRYRMLMVLWTVDTSDYRDPGANAIVKSVVSGARPGAIILMHDAGGNRADTVAALPRIIRALRRRGYHMVSVPKLLLDNPAPPNQQISAVIGAGG